MKLVPLPGPPTKLCEANTRPGPPFGVACKLIVVPGHISVGLAGFGTMVAVKAGRFSIVIELLVLPQMPFVTVQVTVAVEPGATLTEAEVPDELTIEPPVTDHTPVPKAGVAALTVKGPTSLHLILEGVVIDAVGAPTFVNVTLELDVQVPFVTVQVAVADVPGATPETVVEELFVGDAVPPVTVQTPVPGEGLLAVKLNTGLLH